MPASAAGASIWATMPRRGALLLLPTWIWLIVVLISLAPMAHAEQRAVIRVEMREFAFRPSTIRIAARRPVRLVLSNRGEIAHQFDAPLLRRLPAVVSDGVVRVETGGLDLVRLQPGGTATIDLYLRTPGRFSFACTIEGHREAGMVGTLDVR